MESTEPSFWARHSFAIRRLHSLSGLVPVGGYMVIHLLVNSTVLQGYVFGGRSGGDVAFQSNVANIHKFGSLLPFLEWTFIFIPILFHAVVGMVIVAGALPNTHHYPYEANYRYTLQRVTGIIAFFYIGFHVFHMHGWFHNAWWTEYVVGPLGGGKFKPYNATSTAGLALQPLTVTAVYVIGVLSCVYHLANGLWTMGITWGLWTSPHAQRRALGLCAAFGVFLALVGMGALFKMRALTSTEEQVRQIEATEARIINARIESGDLLPDAHKMSHPPEPKTPQAAARSDR